MYLLRDSIPTTYNNDKTNSNNSLSVYLGDPKLIKENKVVSILAATRESDTANKVYGSEQSNFNEGVDDMDNNKILEMYISKVDKDSSEIKQDIRNIETRMDERLNRIEDMISTQNNNMNAIINELSTRIDSKLDKLDSKVEQKTNLLNDKVDRVKEDIGKEATERSRYWIGITVSVIVGIGGIIATIISANL